MTSARLLVSCCVSLLLACTASTNPPTPAGRDDVPPKPEPAPAEPPRPAGGWVADQDDRGHLDVVAAKAIGEPRFHDGRPVAAHLTVGCVDGLLSLILALDQPLAVADGEGALLRAVEWKVDDGASLTRRWRLDGNKRVLRLNANMGRLNKDDPLAGEPHSLADLVRAMQEGRALAVAVPQDGAPPLSLSFDLQGFAAAFEAPARGCMPSQ